MYAQTKLLAQKLLQPEGFVLTAETKRMSETIWTRPSAVPGCFEELEIKHKGAGSPAYVFAKCSVLPGEAKWALMEKHTFLDERYLRTTEQRRDWAAFLREKAIPACGVLASETGLELLAKTAKARQAAWFYFSKLPVQRDPLDELLASMVEQSTDVERELARKSLRMELINMWFNPSADFDPVFAAYRICAFLIVHNAPEAESLGFFNSDCDSDEDIELAWCYQFLATLILDRPMAMQIAH